MFNEKEALDKVINKIKKTSMSVGSKIPYQTRNGHFSDMAETD